MSSSEDPVNFCLTDPDPTGNKVFMVYISSRANYLDKNQQIQVAMKHFMYISFCKKKFSKNNVLNKCYAYLDKNTD